MTDVGLPGSRNDPHPPGVGCGLTLHGWQSQPRSREYCSSRGALSSGARCRDLRTDHTLGCDARAPCSASQLPPLLL